MTSMNNGEFIPLCTIDSVKQMDVVHEALDYPRERLSDKIFFHFCTCILTKAGAKTPVVGTASLLPPP